MSFAWASHRSDLFKLPKTEADRGYIGGEQYDELIGERDQVSWWCSGDSD